MFAIVEIAGQQFKVEEGKKIFVHRLEVEEGNQIDFDKVLLIENGEKVTIGEPTIKDAVIKGKVLDHKRGDKVIVLKKKRRKGYRVKNGHRQNFTQIEIVNISAKASAKKATPKQEKVKVAEVKATEVPAAEKKSPEKKSPEKKPAAKKPAVKKAAPKKTPKGKE